MNPGSVGQPKDGDTRAAYAVWKDGEVELRRIAYPIETTVQAYARTPLASLDVESLIAVLRTGELCPEKQRRLIACIERRRRLVGWFAFSFEDDDFRIGWTQKRSWLVARYRLEAYATLRRRDSIWVRAG